MVRSKVPIADAHMHLTMNGIGVDTFIRRFRSVNGWFVALVSLPPHHYGLEETIEGFIKSLNIHVEICRKLRSEGIRTYCIAGLHPAFIDRLSRHLKVDEVIKYIDEALKVLEKLIRKGYIDGLGEFGRPHYKSLPIAFTLNDIALIEALRIARDYDVVIHLHLEDSGLATVLSIKKFIDLIGIKNEKKVVLHHSSLKTSEIALKYLLSSTVTGRYEMLSRLVSSKELIKSHRILIESDYIDDPKRPGVVMYPWEIAQAVEKVIQDFGNEAIELIYELMVRSIEDIYEVKYE